MFRQSFPDLGLSLERGTENVPDDGRYHLSIHGEIVESFGAERSALKAYETLRQRLIIETGWSPDSTTPGKDELLARARAEADARAVQRESTRDKRANRTRKGGPGR